MGFPVQKWADIKSQVGSVLLVSQIRREEGQGALGFPAGQLGMSQAGWRVILSGQNSDAPSSVLLVDVVSVVHSFVPGV